MADAVTSERVIALARQWLGTPYLHQASLKGVGCDCLGLVRGIWRELYGDEPERLPAYSPDWAEASGEETLAAAAKRYLKERPLADIRPGHLLLMRFRPHLAAKHAAIASGEGLMIHAQEGAGVCEVPMSPWWRRRIAFVFSFE